ncbi:MAG: AMP-binding protein [Pseudomonadota bacterium]
MGQTIDSWLETHATHQPEKPALICDTEVWTYAEFATRVRHMAARLVHDHGLQRGDRIAYLGHNSPAEVALMFAAARAGLMLIPLNWRLASDELTYIAQNADVQAFFHGSEMAETATGVAAGLGLTSLEMTDALMLAGAPAAPSGDLTDPFLLVYTSGTTGRPKGAVLTQEAVFWNALISGHAHDFSSKDRVLNMLPLFHVGGINIQMMPCFYAGGTVVLMRSFNPSEGIDLLETAEVSVALVVPTVMRALFADPGWASAKLPDVRLLAIGSTDVPVDILASIHARDIPMIQIYGATETGPVTTYQKAPEAHATQGSIGRPGQHVSIRIVDPQGQDCPTDEAGEIWVKAPNIFSHYWRNADATQAALVDGWFRTGDVARRDQSGLLWFVGRLKHVIISGGENIYPAEIERILAPLDGVAEVAVVGRKNERWGQIPVILANVSPDGPTAEDLIAACDGKIARFKMPKDVVFVPALPRNALGKVLFEDACRMAER